MAVTRSVLLLGLAVGTACGNQVPPPATVAEYHAVQAAEIGGEEGEGALSDVFGVAVAPDGPVYVSEPQFGRVVEFDREGAFSRTVGGPGQGPGEFRVPGGLFWRGDSLAVADFTSGISLFGPDGTFHDRISFIISVPGTPFGGRPVLPLADGSIGVVVAPNAAGPTQEQAAQEVWLKASRTGDVLDTLALLPMRGRTYSFEAHGRPRQGVHPLAWAPLIAMPPSGTSFVIVDRSPASAPDSASFRVLRLDLTGDTVDARSFVYVPKSIGGGVVDSIAAAMAGRMARQLEVTPAALTDIIRRELEWPDFEPPVSNLLVGSDGSVWLAREELRTEQVEWDILDESFESIGRIQLPKSLELKVVSREVVWAVEKDSLDVPHILRFDVVEGR